MMMHTALKECLYFIKMEDNWYWWGPLGLHNSDKVRYLRTFS